MMAKVIEADFDELIGAKAPEPLAIRLDETRDALKKRELEEIEDSLYRNSTEVLSGALRFADLTPEEIGADEPPEHWVDEVGLESARRQFRSAKYALMNSKDAPVGLGIAQKIQGNISKARAARQAAPQTLNVAILVQNSGQPPLEIVDVEED